MAGSNASPASLIMASGISIPFADKSGANATAGHRHSGWACPQAFWMSLGQHGHPGTFASITMGMPGRHLAQPAHHATTASQPAQLVFSLASAPPGASRGVLKGPQGPVSDGDSSGDKGGSSSGDDSSSGAEEDLTSLDCNACRKPLLHGSPAQRQHQVDRLKVCDACHKCFHHACAKKATKGAAGRAGRMWFCSLGCQGAHQALTHQCGEGDTAVPPSAIRTLQQANMRAQARRADSGPQQADIDEDQKLWLKMKGQGTIEVLHTGEPTWQLAAGAARRGSTQWEAVSDAVEVLAEAHGPFVLRQVEGSDYCAVLRRGGEAVAAATLDCFGQAGCAMELLVTRTTARKQGHARALVESLQAFLVDAAARQLLAVVPEPRSEDGRAAVEMWQRHLGFAKMSNRQVKQLQAEFPLLALYGEGAAVLSRKVGQGRGPKVGKGGHRQDDRHQPSWSTAVIEWQPGEDGLTRPLTGSAKTTKASAASQISQVGTERHLPAEEQETDGQEAKRHKPKRSHYKLRLWGWALRKVANTATFGLVGNK